MQKGNQNQQDSYTSLSRCSNWKREPKLFRGVWFRFSRRSSSSLIFSETGCKGKQNIKIEFQPDLQRSPQYTVSKKFQTRLSLPFNPHPDTSTATSTPTPTPMLTPMLTPTPTTALWGDKKIWPQNQCLWNDYSGNQLNWTSSQGDSSSTISTNIQSLSWSEFRFRCNSLYLGHHRM